MVYVGTAFGLTSVTKHNLLFLYVINAKDFSRIFISVSSSDWWCYKRTLNNYLVACKWALKEPFNGTLHSNKHGRLLKSHPGITSNLFPQKQFPTVHTVPVTAISRTIVPTSFRNAYLSWTLMLRLQHLDIPHFIVQATQNVCGDMKGGKLVLQIISKYLADRVVFNST